jgi:hypothetical protein
MAFRSNEQDLQLAVKSKRRDPRISLSKRAKMFHIPPTALRDQINGKLSRRETMPDSF